MATEFFSRKEDWTGGSVFMENICTLAALHGWRVLAASGVLNVCAGLVAPSMDKEDAGGLRKVLREAGREDLPVPSGVDFGHRTPMAVCK